MKYKSQKIDGYDVYYSADWINGLENEIHFNWYYHQAKLVYEKCNRDDRILEIGIGTGLLSDMLKKRGWKMKTLDIDEHKEPDYCVNALDFDYKVHHIDTVLAFEIFEHIPFETFKKVIRKISDSDVKAVYFSLPWNEVKAFGMSVKLPKFKEFSRSIWLSRNNITTHAHFWELSKKDRQLKEKQLVSFEQIKKIIEQAGFILKPEERIGGIQYFSALSGKHNDEDIK